MYNFSATVSINCTVPINRVSVCHLLVLPHSDTTPPRWQRTWASSVLRASLLPPRWATSPGSRTRATAPSSTCASTRRTARWRRACKAVRRRLCSTRSSGTAPTSRRPCPDGERSERQRERERERERERGGERERCSLFGQKCGDRHLGEVAMKARVKWLAKLGHDPQSISQC